MSLRTKSSKARNYSNTLPIEDWAKGVSNLLTRRKSTASKSSPRLSTISQPTPPMPESPSMGYSAFVTSAALPEPQPQPQQQPEQQQRQQIAPPPRSPARSLTIRSSISSASSARAPIKNWIKSIPDTEHSPEFQMVPAPLSIDRASPQSTPLIPPSPRTDWGSEFAESEPDTSAIPYKNRLENLVDASSRIHVAGKTGSTADVSPVSSRSASIADHHISRAEFHLSNDLSQEYLSDKPFDESLLPAHIRNASSKGSRASGSIRHSVCSSQPSLTQEQREQYDLTAAMLGLSAPSFRSGTASEQSSRPASVALTDSSYYTADESDLEGSPYVPNLAAIQSAMPGAYLTDEEPATAPVISREVVDSEPSRDIPASPAVDSQDIVNTILESYMSTPAKEIPASAESSLACTLPTIPEQQVVEKKPSSTIVTVQSLQEPSPIPEKKIDTADHQDIADHQSVGSGSEGNASPVESASDGTSLSLSSMSIKMARRVRPARHYKMVNGVICEVEPWRIPGQFDLTRYTPAPSETSEGDADISSMSEGSLFVSNAENPSWLSKPVALTA